MTESGDPMDTTDLTPVAPVTEDGPTTHGEAVEA